LTKKSFGTKSKIKFDFAMVIKMTKRSTKSQKAQTESHEFVVVTFAKDWEQAKDYETLLKNNDIPTIIREQHEDAESSGIAVLVAEDFIDEAHVIIESQDAYDDFYDLALEQEDDGEFDGTFLQEDF